MDQSEQRPKVGRSHRPAGKMQHALPCMEAVKAAAVPARRALLQAEGCLLIIPLSAFKVRVRYRDDWTDACMLSPVDGMEVSITRNSMFIAIVVSAATAVASTK